MSEDSFDVDVVSQRSFRTFTPLVIGNGVLNFPPGTIINTIGSSLTLDGRFLDSLPQENIVQGLSLANPNTVASTTTRSLMVSTADSSLTGTGTRNTVLSTDVGNIDDSSSCYLLGTTNCSIQENSTGATTYTGISGSSTCTTDSNGSGNINYSAIDDSVTSTMISNTGSLSSDRISSCNTCGMNASTADISRSLITGCINCTTTNNGTNGIVQTGIINSAGSSITHAGTNLQSSSLIDTSTCTLTTTLNDVLRCAIIASDTSGINGGQSSLVAASSSGTISSSATDRTVNTALIGTDTCSVNSTAGLSQRIAVLGSNNAIISGPSNNVLASGSSPVVNARTNVFCHGATATASNQAIFGTRVDITGTGSHLTIGSGYVNTARGVAQPLTLITADHGLGATDQFIRVNSATGRTINIPTASTMSASFPVNTARTWVISAREATPVGNSTELIINSGGLFNNVAGLNRVDLDEVGSPLTLTLVNDATPYWHLGPFIRQTAKLSTAVAVGAASIVTSTSEANHYTKTSWWTLETLSTANTTLFAKSTSDLGMETMALGYGDMIITLKVTHTTAAVGTPYIIRMDVHNSAGGATVPESYAEFCGTNDVSGSSTFQYRVPRSRMVVGNYRIRVTTDATYPLAAPGQITYVRWELVQFF
jgi:hypothetical protein